MALSGCLGSATDLGHDLDEAVDLPRLE